MEYEKPELSDLYNESDVEQKFIYPLVTAELPSGFGIKSELVITKANIRRFEIDKGNQRKIYFPDYVISIGGHPLAVIEGKAPGVDLTEAYREARLYSAELNAIFPHGLNPVALVCATNANETWIGLADQAQPSLKMTFDEVSPYSKKMAEAQSLLGMVRLEHIHNEILKTQKPDNFFKPRRLIGGLSIQQEEVGHNSFGATLAAEMSHIFNPVNREDRLRIARDGYVSSPRRERYVDPIDKIIRAATPSWQVQSTLIRDPAQPVELLRPFVAPKSLEHRILLLIGERGAGKTTFLYHLQAVALPKEVREHTVWVHLDVNTAPVVKGEIYDWTRAQIIRGIELSFPQIDFEAIDTIQHIFSVEVNKFNKGLGALLTPGSTERNFELYKVLLGCQQDLHQKSTCYTRHFGSERGALIVIVFDNADKKPRDEQLLMFEVAQWLQREFRVLVVLPIREETYDNHRKEPPLDTALKDLVFRIEPPVFQQALVRRVQLALDELANSEERRTYELANGIKVTYAESERSYYITSIVASIFAYDSYVRRLIMGLAGNDLRRIFEIFVEFCTSGHIGEGEILRMRQSKGEYILPLEAVMIVLLRSNRRYYDSDASIIKNILDLDDKDVQPTLFSRILILSYLHARFNESGSSGLKGYFSLAQIVQDLAVYGLSEAVIKREANYLMRADCILAESQSTVDITEVDLLKLGPVGFVHLELLGVAEYWAAIAEDTYFTTRACARRIADRIVVRDEHFTPSVTLQNGRAAFDYIKSVREDVARASSTVLASSRFLELTPIDPGDEALSTRASTIKGGLWFEAVERFPPGSEHLGTVVGSDSSLGLFIDLAPGLTGLLHRSRMSGGVVGPKSPKVGEQLAVRVLTIEPGRRRASLSLPSKRASLEASQSERKET